MPSSESCAQMDSNDYFLGWSIELCFHSWPKCTLLWDAKTHLIIGYRIDLKIWVWIILCTFYIEKSRLKSFHLRSLQCSWKKGWCEWLKRILRTCKKEFPDFGCSTSCSLSLASIDCESFEGLVKEWFGNLDLRADCKRMREKLHLPWSILLVIPSLLGSLCHFQTSITLHFLWWPNFEPIAQFFAGQLIKLFKSEHFEMYHAHHTEKTMKSDWKSLQILQLFTGNYKQLFSFFKFLYFIVRLIFHMVFHMEANLPNKR